MRDYQIHAFPKIVVEITCNLWYPMSASVGEGCSLGLIWRWSSARGKGKA